MSRPSRRRRRSIDGMAAATDVYAFLALIGLLLLAVARFHTPTAAEASVGDALDAPATELRLVAAAVGGEVIGPSGRIAVSSCEGPLPEAERLTLSVPLDGSVSTETVSAAWACIQGRAPSTPLLLTWH